jgi:hypothetical protein
MGVINVYFHAAYAEAALQADVMAPLVGFTTVETKVAEPFVALGKLVALIAEVAWSPDLIGAVVVSPSPATKPTSADAYARLPEDSSWKTGPWLHELSVRARDVVLTPERMIISVATPEHSACTCNRAFGLATTSLHRRPEHRWWFHFRVCDCGSRACI